MSREDILKVRTTVLKVNIHCNGCEQKIKKILRKIDGVYRCSIDAKQGKVTVSGMVDADTIVNKLNKAGKPAALWGVKLGVVSQLQNLQLGGGGKGQPKDVDGKGQNGGASGAGGSVDKDAMVMPRPTPQQHQQPTPQQMHHMQVKGMKVPPHFMGSKMPLPVVAPAAPVKDAGSVKLNVPEEEDDDEGNDVDDELDEFDEDEDFEDHGLNDGLCNDPKTMMRPMTMPQGGGGGANMMMRPIAMLQGGGGGANAMTKPMAMPQGGGGGTKKGGTSANGVPVQIKGNVNNGGGGRKHFGNKQSQGDRGGNDNNGNGGKPPQNAKSSNLGGGNRPGQSKMGDGGPLGGMPPQPGMTRTNMMGGGGAPQPGMMPLNMISGASFHDMGQMGSGPVNMPMSHPHMSDMQQDGGGAGHGMPVRAGFYQGGGSMPPPFIPEMSPSVAATGNPMAQQQQYMAIMQQQQQQQPQMMMNGHGGYPPMGYGYGRPPMHHLMAYPTHAESYNIFSEENPNSSCSVM